LVANIELKQIFMERLAIPSPVRWRRLVWTTALLLICFSAPIYELIRFAAKSELYSYILLIPFVTAYLIWLKQRTIPSGATPATRMGLGFIFAGIFLIAAFWFHRSVGHLQTEDYLAWVFGAFLFLFVGACCLTLPADMTRALAFPIGLLVFILPIPTVLMAWIERFLQEGSASAACALFIVFGTPVARDGLNLQLPGIGLQVAPECSGIHSTMALLITSLLAGYLLLRSPWRRAALAMAVIPLGLLRNGFRIFTIGELCVHIGPEMIHSYIHRRGGPIFFLLSLIPLFLLLVFLRRAERRLARQSAGRARPQPAVQDVSSADSVSI